MHRMVRAAALQLSGVGMHLRVEAAGGAVLADRTACPAPDARPLPCPTLVQPPRLQHPRPDGAVGLPASGAHRPPAAAVAATLIVFPVFAV